MNKEEDSWLSRYRDAKNSPPHSPPQEEEISGKQIAIDLQCNMELPKGGVVLEKIMGASQAAGGNRGIHAK